MIRGIQKNVIWVQTPKNPYFEEVHFVIRRTVGCEETRNGEMAKEANRILAESTSPQKKPQKAHAVGRGARAAIAFLWGMLSGSLLVAGAWLLSILVG